MNNISANANPISGVPLPSSSGGTDYGDYYKYQQTQQTQKSPNNNTNQGQALGPDG